MKIENIVSPGSIRLVDAEKYGAMKRAYLAVVPPEFDTFAPISALDITLKPFRIKHLRPSNVLD